MGRSDWFCRSWGRMVLAVVLLAGVLTGGYPEPVQATVHRFVVEVGTVDPADPVVKPLQGVISGPLQPCGSVIRDLTAHLQDIGVDAIRNNDYLDDRLDISGIFRCSGGVLYPSWGCDPEDPDNYQWTESDTLFQSIVDGGFMPFFRLGCEIANCDEEHYTYSFHGPRADQEENWIAAAIKIAEHYNGWGGAGSGDFLTYLDIFTEWPNSDFWDRGNPAFIAFWARAFRAIKSAFPNLKVGGPGFLKPTVDIIEGKVENNAVVEFLAHLYDEGLKPDWIGWHLWQNGPLRYYQAGRQYRDLLDGVGDFAAVPWAGTGFFDGVEIICDAYGTSRLRDTVSEGGVPEPLPKMEIYKLHNGGKGAAVMSGQWIAMQYADIERAFYYRAGDMAYDPSAVPGERNAGWTGLFYADAAGTYKPTAHAFRLRSMICRSFPELLQVPLPVESEDGSELWVLAARGEEGYAVLVSNIGADDALYSLTIGGQRVLPGDYQVAIYQVDDENDGRTARNWFGNLFTIPGESVQLLVLVPKEDTADNEPGGGCNRWLSPGELWETAANWSLGHVPVCGERVLVGGAGEGAMLRLASAATVGTLEIAAGGRLQLVAAAELNLAGDGCRGRLRNEAGGVETALELISSADGVTAQFTLAQAGPVRLRVVDLLGNEVAVLLNAPSPAGRREIAWNGCDTAGAAVPAGMYWFELAPGDGEVIRRLGFLAPKGRLAAPQAGFNFIRYYFYDTPPFQPVTINDDLIALGCQAARHLMKAGLIWNVIEPRDDEWHFEAADEVIMNAAYEPIVTLFSTHLASPTPPWEDDPHNFRKHLGPEARDYLQTVVERYAPYVRYWELGNEMCAWRAADPDERLPERLPDCYPLDGFSPQEQGAFLAEAAAVVRRYDPDAVILLPGMMGFSDINEWLPGVIAGGGSDWFDVVGYHFYAPWAAYAAGRRQLAEFMRNHGLADKPVWCTETGSTSSPTLTERTDYPNSTTTQAADVFRRLVQAWAAGDQLVVWHTYIGSVEIPGNLWRCYGVRDEDGGEKPAALSFGLLTGELLPFTRVEELSTEPFVYRFTTLAGATKLVVWGSGTYTIPAGISAVAEVVPDDEGRFTWRAVAPGDEITLSEVPQLCR